MSIINGGRYVSATGVVFIISGRTDDIDNSIKMVMVIVGASSSEGKSRNKAATWLILDSVVDRVVDSFLGLGAGSLSGRQRLIVGVSRDREYTHKIAGANIMHKIVTQVLMVQ